MSEPLLQVEALEAGYGEVQVVWGVTLNATRGQLTTIVGANGVGKTTTLRAIAGSIRPWGGRVLFEGEDVTRLTPHLKAARGLVLVPEGRQLFNDMTVEENLEMGAYSTRAKSGYAARLERVYALFTAPQGAAASKSAGTFSGGEQQMPPSRSGLMNDPKIIIIDELTGAGAGSGGPRFRSVP